MKTVTDDPDWAPKLYEARALAIRLVGKHGRWQQGAEPCRVAERNRLRVTYYPHRRPRWLAVDVAGDAHGRTTRVLDIEWNDGDAWRVAIETFSPGRWESRLKASVYPRPWLERWRAMALFTASA